MNIRRRALRAYPDINTAWKRLHEFVGDSFKAELTDYSSCCSFVEEEFARHGPAEFYTRSRGYLYELTHFHFMPHKDAFFDMVVRFATEHGLGDIGDVGCGIGLDAQALIGSGIKVALYDLPSPSLDYAQWRLEADEGLTEVVRPLEALDDHHHELIYAVDVLEHIPDPAAELPRLFEAADFIAVNLFPHDDGPWDGRDMHYPLDHWRLLPEFSRHGDLMEVATAGETVCTLWRSRRVSGP